jgi:hypothetical protein
VKDRPVFFDDVIEKRLNPVAERYVVNFEWIDHIALLLTFGCVLPSKFAIFQRHPIPFAECRAELVRTTSPTDFLSGFPGHCFMRPRFRRIQSKAYIYVTRNENVL